MNFEINQLNSIFGNWIPFSITLVIGIFFIYIAQLIVKRRSENSVGGRKIYFQLGVFGLFNVLLIALVLSSPLSETIKGQLLSLFGITFTAAVALSSTTFLGNIMAGLMIKVVGKFRPGDFLKVEKHFGRVTELGLLHTEIQTEDGDLLTLPNIYLVSNPVKVIRSTGTIISEEVSLGYDVHHNAAEKALLEAAKACGLNDVFMHTQSLGDFSVTYRVSGFLKDIKTVLSTKSKLREEMLDSLHANGIEIVSPNFMNQRIYEAGQPFIPAFQKDTSSLKGAAENIIFDKAKEAESLENLKSRVEQCQAKLKEIACDEDLSKEEKESQTKSVEAQIETLKNYIKNKE